MTSKQLNLNPEHCMIEDVYGEDVDLWKMLTWTRKYLYGLGEPTVDEYLFDVFLAIKWFYDNFYEYDCKTYGPIPNQIIKAVDELEEASLFGDERSWVRAYDRLKSECEKIFEARKRDKNMYLRKDKN